MQNENVQIKKDPAIQAIHILKSYLSSLGITFSPGSEPSTLSVKTATGSHINVLVGQGAAEVTIDPLDMVSCEVDRAYSALHAVTRAAGYGSPTPVDRGEAPAGRISYKDDFERVYLRWSLFARSPNLTSAELEPWMKPIRSSARRAMFRWNNVFQPMGFAESDLVNVGIVYAISFIHHYATDPVHENNVKLLVEFLEQRFGEFAKISWKKALNSTCLPQVARSEMSDDGEVSYIDAYCETEEAAPDEEYGDDVFELTYRDGSKRRLEVKGDGFVGLKMVLDGRDLRRSEAQALTEDLRTGKIQKRLIDERAEDAEVDTHARKEEAKKELLRRLDELTPEDREIKLGYAALSRDYCPDARREARRLANELACPKCMKKVPSGTVCTACGVEARPRYGVDYMALREKLRAERSTMAEAMSAAIPESEARAQAKRPAMREVAPIANGPVVINKTTSTVSSKECKLHALKKAGVKGAALKLVKDEEICLHCQHEKVSRRKRVLFMRSLPQHMDCPKCQRHLHKLAFGIRVAKDTATGIPDRASRQSYCKECRRP